MATTQANVKVSLKLLVNTCTNKVLFAEAEKDFVDILFSFLMLPLGTIARLVEKESDMEPVTIGSLHSLYHSANDLHECLLDQKVQEMLLHPRNLPEEYCNTIKLNIDDPVFQKYFGCTKFASCRYPYFSPFKTQRFCTCGSPLTHKVFLKHSLNGFVNASASYVITDDLVVMPNSVHYVNLALFQSMGIKDLSSVKEMTVNLTKEKMLDLLKCSLISTSSLTHLFLENKPILERSKIFSCSVENNRSIKISVNLVIRKSDGKVLYAQGDKDFADMILSFLSFPLGGVIRMMGGNCSLGSIDGLYKTTADINEETPLMSNEVKNRLIDPCLVSPVIISNPMLPFTTSLELRYSIDQKNSSGTILNVSVGKGLDYDKPLYLSNFIDFNGFVKGSATYMATDDLVVAPFSPISALNFINRLKTPFGDLKEKSVILGYKECVNILKASLTSTSVLTKGLSHLLTDVK